MPSSGTARRYASGRGDVVRWRPMKTLAIAIAATTAALLVTAGAAYAYVEYTRRKANEQ